MNTQDTVAEINDNGFREDDYQTPRQEKDVIYCPSCGTENRADAAFCNGCGQRLNAGSQGGQPAKAQSKQRSFYNYPEGYTPPRTVQQSSAAPAKYYSMALPIVSFLLGLFSLLLSVSSTVSNYWMSVPTLFMGIMGLILASIVKRRGQRSGLATAGKVLSIIGIVISAMIFVVFIQQIRYLRYYF